MKGGQENAAGRFDRQKHVSSTNTIYQRQRWVLVIYALSRAKSLNSRF
jgi:hypothetical protein